MFAHEVKNAIIFTQEGTSFNVVYTAQVGFNYDAHTSPWAMPCC